MTPHDCESTLLTIAGSDNQRERWNAGLLPDDELLTIARAELFKPFDGIRRWSASNAHEAMKNRLRHEGKPHPADVELEVADVAEMRPDQWERLKAITRATSETNQLTRFGPVTATVSTSTHWITCRVCGAEEDRSCARVVITWAGRDLVREYSLDLPTVKG